MTLFNLRLGCASLIAKLLVLKQGLKINCLLTRYPIVWIDPNFKECIQLALLREHGFQISATRQRSQTRNTKEHVLVSQKKATPFNQLLEDVIALAEKDLLEI